MSHNGVCKASPGTFYSAGESILTMVMVSPIKMITDCFKLTDNNNHVCTGRSMGLWRIGILYLYCDERRDILWNIAWAWGKSQSQSPLDFPRTQAIFHRMSRLESQYRYSQLQLQHYPSCEINIGRGNSPYCSFYWAIREYIAQLIESYWSVKFQYYNV